MANISVAAPPAGRAGPRLNERPGILRRVLAAMMESRQLKANQEIARILARRGDLFR
jgi:hypothetical protein